VRKVAPYRFGAPGKPFRRRSGVPFHSAGQKPSPRASPLSTSRAPEGALRRCDADHSRSAPPSPASSPSAHEEPRIRCSRACLTRHLPPSAFLTPSAACTPRPRPGLFHPGNAPGVSPSGPCSSPGGRTSLEAACSRAVRIPSQRVQAPCGSAVFRAFLSPESPFRERPKPARGRCPPGVLPSKALPASAVGPAHPTTSCPRGHGDGASRPLLPCAFSRRSSCPDARPALRSIPRRRPRHFLPQHIFARFRELDALTEAPAFLGFVASSRAATEAAAPSVGDRFSKRISNPFTLRNTKFVRPSTRTGAWVAPTTGELGAKGHSPDDRVPQAHGPVAETRSSIGQPTLQGVRSASEAPLDN
jgi:hypothetical protein